ncbi:hypothetical protein L596_020849 [Steinernema carpocapsae]|uniref:Uncharacterized protein n=1 Tax=Steinernema carpocapsae TaxID=34508 RepID=A0A4U5MUS8_STECR|nr:hypothetical protein L596_020774 [Steinernema carpocapsae]TKR73551.1 hypothetical protein L596_020849 [Steinernema carpocapsae]
MGISLMAQFAITLIIPKTDNMEESDYVHFVESLRASWTIIMLVILAMVPLPVWSSWIIVKYYKFLKAQKIERITL